MRKIEKNDTLYHFTVVDARPLPELPGTLWELRHQGTGARLVWLEREDENKTFGIAFRTLPEDDTGVFHILEHSVLCGSERYPVKEPFVELMKSSLQTFLNAMTFPDKTFYPVSSRNDKDFINLTRVYLDAVFRPRIYAMPEIFRQEGWHYELDEAGKPHYKGVVFNEMKGSFASPDTLIQNETFRLLFPDTSYRFVSGGDPAHIPELTYERFLDCHRRFYHPSNAYIFLDGRLDLEQVLSILDGEYLSAWDGAAEQPAFVLQRPVRSGLVTAYYEVGGEEDAPRKARLVWGRVLGDFTSLEEQMAVQVLGEVLCGGNQAPLKRALLDRGLAQDVRLSVMDGILQPYALLEAQNIDGGQAEAVEAALRVELERLVREGLDRRMLAAALANLEFQTRERDYGSIPRGLAFGLTALSTWLYGGDPAASLEVGELFASLNRKAEEGWFEALLERLFLHNPHGCELLLLPSAALGAQTRAGEEARLQAAAARWDQAERTALEREQEALLAWQTAEDTPQARATLPRLTLDDVSDTPAELPTREAVLGDRPLLYHPIPAGGIRYINLYFDASDLPEEALPLASLLCRLLGELGTASHSAGELRTLRQLLLGELSLSLEAYSGVNAPETCQVLLCVSFSALDQKTRDAAALVAELLTETSFADREALRAILRQTITDLEQQLITSGAQLAINRVMAGCSAQGVVQERAESFAFYQWLKDLERDFDGRAEGLADELSRLCRRVLVRERLTVSVTGAAPEEALETALLAALPQGRPAEGPCPLRPWGRRKEGIVIPAGISFAALGGSLLPHGGRYCGAARVLGRIASLSWLWNAVRVQGGAYGTGLVLGDQGCACFYSYRDPSAKRSLGCYRQTADFLRGFLADRPDLTGAILGAVAEADPLLLPRRQGKTADSLHFKGMTWEDRRALRRDMLTATPERLAELVDCLEGLSREGGVCVIGSQDQIDACGRELDAVYTL